jgi:hypothetical protein
MTALKVRDIRGVSGVNVLASGKWLTGERVHAVAWISGVIGLAMLAFLLLGGNGTVDRFGQPVGTDFTAFYHAGQFANAGEAARAYDLDTINAVVRATHGVDYPIAWIYPPSFLFLAAPLAQLPYLPALLIWQALGVAAIALTLHAILGSRAATLVALASPLTPLVLAGGQNAFLSAALLGAGLLLFDRKRSHAGAAFGALTYKPQLGLTLVPLLLLTRNWRAITAAVLVAVALALLSAAIWGVAAWTAFPTGLANAREWMEQGTSQFEKSASLFSMIRLWGGSLTAAYSAQALGVLAGVALVVLAARRGTDVRGAAVCAAAALSTPYLMDYDMATVGIGAAFLYAGARNEAFLPYERSALAFIWIAPWFTRVSADHLLLPLGPIATLLLAIMVVRRARLTASPSRRSHAASAR